ncbi:MAG TPA: GDSL-type esterase/lipase family protein [Bacteroidia bacterium]|jgi:lysophospholipase L1-like esterase|nr:GDSL-type esterase/lipase family protein [Bacteroidia bacterium]
MIKKVLFVLCVCVQFVCAQEKKYPFVNYSQNVVYHGKDSSDMMNFYKKLNNYLQGKEKEIVIAHIGGSHVQGGFWGDELITKFQSLKKTEGSGFFAFPYKIVKTNSPPYYKSFSNGKWKRCRSATAKEMCGDFGMAGITATTNDSANTFGVKIDSCRHHRTFNSVKVFHNFNKSFELSLGNNVNATRSDFPGAGYSEFVWEKQIDSVSFSVVKKDTFQKDFVLYGLDVRNTSKPGMYYAALGANGASTQSVLRCKLLTQQLAGIQPDLVIFSLGVNDVQDKFFSPDEYIAHYDTLVSWVKAASPNCAILFTTITDNYVKRRKPNKKSNTVEYCIQKLTHKHSAAMWDMYGVMGGYKSILKWQKAGYARKDKVHFTAKGYYIFADLMFDAIMRSYKYNYPK